MFPQVGRGQRVHGAEVGIAITSAEGDGFDGLAASGTLFRVTPSGKGRLHRLLGFVDRRGVLATVGAAAADFGPTFIMIKTITTRTTTDQFSRFEFCVTD